MLFKNKINKLTTHLKRVTNISFRDKKKLTPKIFNKILVENYPKPNQMLYANIFYKIIIYFIIKIKRRQDKKLYHIASIQNMNCRII